MTLSRLALMGGLLAGPALPGLAQTTAPTPRYYVGLAVCNSDYQVLSVRADGNGLTVPVQLTLGYQLRPRLAVQLGVTYSGDSYSYANTGKYCSPNSTVPAYSFINSGSNSSRNTSVALLGRYTLTRQPDHRVQVDLLGGLGLEYRRFRYSSTNTTTDSTQTVASTQYDARFNLNDVLLMAGASTRYRFGRHLEAVLDVTLSTPLGPNRFFNLGAATALGLRYRFGS